MAKKAGKVWVWLGGVLAIAALAYVFMTPYNRTPGVRLGGTLTPPPADWSGLNIERKPGATTHRPLVQLTHDNDPRLHTDLVVVDENPHALGHQPPQMAVRDAELVGNQSAVGEGRLGAGAQGDMIVVVTPGYSGMRVNGHMLHVRNSVFMFHYRSTL